VNESCDEEKVKKRKTRKENMKEERKKISHG
jgi:hypothetical protein